MKGIDLLVNLWRFPETGGFPDDLIAGDTCREIACPGGDRQARG
jgi:hypothetical protein